MFDYIYIYIVPVFEIHSVQYSDKITLYNLWLGQRLSIFSIDQLCIKWLCKPDILFDWLDIYGTWWHDIFCGTWSLKTWQAIHAIVFWLMIPILFWSFWHWWEHKKITSYGKFLIGICVLTRHHASKPQNFDFNTKQICLLYIGRI